MRAFGQAYDAALADPSVRAQFRLAEWEESLLDIEPGYAGAHRTSRLDLFVIDPERGAPADSGSMALTEYNGEVPAGAGYADALTEAFLDLPAMREFQRSWRA